MTEAIRDTDQAAFAELIEPYRRELHAHCYRMLGSVHDADDALQETLLGAWKGRSGFEGRSSLISAATAFMGQGVPRSAEIPVPTD
jgi:RNA polymerase sigma-70 factor (ECF subfamily)